MSVISKMLLNMKAILFQAISWIFWHITMVSKFVSNGEKMMLPPGIIEADIMSERISAVLFRNSTNRQYRFDYNEVRSVVGLGEKLYFDSSLKSKRLATS